MKYKLEEVKEIEKKVSDNIARNSLIGYNEHLYVAVSGGADSMVLLTYLVRKYDKSRITAVHVNHGIRGKSADDDMYYVMNHCSKNGIDLVVFNAKEDGTIIPKNPSEEWARNLRYGYFATLISHWDDKLVTAHTLSDQAETILFKMARGCHVHGIPVKMGYIIRPLLVITREEVEKLAEYYELSYVTDETNLETSYSRNKLRINVVPVLKEINSRSVENIVDFAEKVESAFDIVHKLGMKSLQKAEVVPLYKYRTADLWSLLDDEEIVFDDAIKTMVGVFTSYQVSQLMINLVKGEILECRRCTKNQLPDKVRILQIANNVRMGIDSQNITFILDKQLSKPVTPNLGRTLLGYLPISQVDIDEIPIKEYLLLKERNRNSRKYFACADKLNLSECTLELVKEGDQFTPISGNEHTVLKLLRNIPAVDRRMVPVIKDANGKVIWVKGLGFTSGYAPTSSSKRVLQIM